MISPTQVIKNLHSSIINHYSQSFEEYFGGFTQSREGAEKNACVSAVLRDIFVRNSEK